jgi:hypothetical protein
MVARIRVPCCLHCPDGFRPTAGGRELGAGYCVAPLARGPGRDGEAVAATYVIDAQIAASDLAGDCLSITIPVRR